MNDVFDAIQTVITKAPEIVQQLIEFAKTAQVKFTFQFAEKFAFKI